MNLGERQFAWTTQITRIPQWLLAACVMHIGFFEGMTISVAPAVSQETGVKLEESLVIHHADNMGDVRSIGRSSSKCLATRVLAASYSDWCFQRDAENHLSWLAGERDPVAGETARIELYKLAELLETYPNAVRQFIPQERFAGQISDSTKAILAKIAAINPGGRAAKFGLSLTRRVPVSARGAWSKIPYKEVKSSVSTTPSDALLMLQDDQSGEKPTVNSEWEAIEFGDPHEGDEEQQGQSSSSSSTRPPGNKQLPAFNENPTNSDRIEFHEILRSDSQVSLIVDSHMEERATALREAPIDLQPTGLVAWSDHGDERKVAFLCDCPLTPGCGCGRIFNPSQQIPDCIKPTLNRIIRDAQLTGRLLPAHGRPTALINWHRSGQGITWHRDDEDIFNNNLDHINVIGCSFGATARIGVRSDDRSFCAISPLEPGAIWVMRGTPLMRRVERARNLTAERISITIRWLAGSGDGGWPVSPYFENNPAGYIEDESPPLEDDLGSSEPWGVSLY